MLAIVVTFTSTKLIEERNLFSIVYENIIEARKALWRIIFSIEQKKGEEVMKRRSSFGLFFRSHSLIH
jgi:hypothetical protein